MTTTAKTTNKIDPLDELEQDEYRGDEDRKLPGCQLLNYAKKPVLFIKEEELAKAAWVGSKEYGEPYSHSYSGKKDSTPGLAFKSPRMHILLKSPRLVELTQKGAERYPELGKSGDIIANADTPEGAAFRDRLDAYTTALRTFYLIFLVDNKGKNLHKIPFVLSIKGGAARAFGMALDAFYVQLELAFSNRKGETDEHFTLGALSRSFSVFTPTLGLGESGIEQKSIICVPESWEIPTPENVWDFILIEKKQAFSKLRDRYSGFARNYMAHISESVGVHQIAPGVDLETIDVQSAAIPY